MKSKKIYPSGATMKQTSDSVMSKYTFTTLAFFAAMLISVYRGEGSVALITGGFSLAFLLLVLYRKLAMVEIPNLMPDTAEQAASQL